jgi:hypothetical protein
LWPALKRESLQDQHGSETDALVVGAEWELYLELVFHLVDCVLGVNSRWVAPENPAPPKR